MSSVRSSLATAGKFALAASRNKKLQHGKLLLTRIILTISLLCLSKADSHWTSHDQRIHLRYFFDN